MSKELFKFQIELSRFGAQTRPKMVLIYNRSRSMLGEIELTKELDTLFDAYGPKFYAKAAVEQDGRTLRVNSLDVVVPGTRQHEAIEW